MGKILCTCGQIIFDQSDFIKNKAHVISNQDYMDFFEEAENKNFREITGKAAKYFTEIFQCNNCNRLIIFRPDKDQAIFFIPENKENSNDILSSYLGEKWLGTMSGNFTDGQGEIFWETNLESGFLQNLTLVELQEIYNKKFTEFYKLKILRHSFLRIDNKIKHEFDSKQKSSY
ncbi:MAG: hypothetical protein JSR09_01260 [Bacteroidetes bacterium]|nr:hypothetical protein [Bacteroidota bacterium]MBS1648307.1 hypothetical protein [Bacteroidota bacterium]